MLLYQYRPNATVDILATKLDCVIEQISRIMRFSRAPVHAVLWNRKRNRRNYNFLNSATRTVTVINYGSGTGTNLKILFFISFIKHFFLSHSTINLLKFVNFFLITAYLSKLLKNLTSS
jgi:hypothetical protein